MKRADAAQVKQIATGLGVDNNTAMMILDMMAGDSVGDVDLSKQAGKPKPKAKPKEPTP